MLGNEPLEGGKLEVAVSASGALQYSVFLLLEKVRGFGIWVVGLRDGKNTLEVHCLAPGYPSRVLTHTGTVVSHSLVHEQSTWCVRAALEFR